MKLFKPFNGDFPVTQSFGEKITNPGGHTGIDYALYTGTAVLASADGVVSLAVYSTTDYGNHIILDHGDGYQTLYAHLSEISVSVNQNICRGQIIGASGKTGNSTGPHLHFELRLNQTPVDPQPFLDGIDGNAVEPSVITPEQTPVRKWEVACPVLNVRSGPSIGYPVCEQLREGDFVTESDRFETLWIRIGNDRWASAIYCNEELML